MQPTALLFYAVFALVLVTMYIGIRREWLSPMVLAGGGVLGSIIAMTLVSLAQENSILQALIVGFLVGGIFSGATLAVAWYFHSIELRERYGHTRGHTPQDSDELPQEGETYY